MCVCVCVCVCVYIYMHMYIYIGWTRAQTHTPHARTHARAHTQQTNTPTHKDESIHTHTHTPESNTYIIWNGTPPVFFSCRAQDGIVGDARLTVSDVNEITNQLDPLLFIHPCMHSHSLLHALPSLCLRNFNRAQDGIVGDASLMVSELRARSMQARKAVQVHLFYIDR